MELEILEEIEHCLRSMRAIASLLSSVSDAVSLQEETTREAGSLLMRFSDCCRNSCEDLRRCLTERENGGRTGSNPHLLYEDSPP